MELQDLFTRFPSVASTASSPLVSKKYKFINTVNLIDSLKSYGWAPVSVQEQRTRDINKIGFQKHTITFRSENFPAIDGIQPVVILVNSHDAKSAYKIYIGLFRFICSNGMVIAHKGMADMLRVRHDSINVNQVDEYLRILADKFTKLFTQINLMRNFNPTQAQILQFLTESASLRWKGVESAKVMELLNCRRPEDNQDDMWSILNRVQENMVRGGVKMTKRTAREIKNIDMNININTGIWDAAMKVMPTTTEVSHAGL